MTDLLVLWDVDGLCLPPGGNPPVTPRMGGLPVPPYPPGAGRTDRAIILETLELAGVPEPRRHVDPFIARLAEHAPGARAAVAARGRALPGAVAALAALAAAGASPAAGSTGRPPAGWSGRVRQSVLTGNIRAVAVVKLAALGLCDPLDLRIGAYGDDHEVRTELVGVARRRAAASRDGSPAEFGGRRTVLVGDTPLDIEAALTSGARAVGVATGLFPVAGLRAAGAHAVLPDLTDTDLVVRAILSLCSPACQPGPPRAGWPTGGPSSARQAGEQGLS